MKKIIISLSITFIVCIATLIAALHFNSTAPVTYTITTNGKGLYSYIDSEGYKSQFTWKSESEVWDFIRYSEKWDKEVKESNPANFKPVQTKN